MASQPCCPGSVPGAEPGRSSTRQRLPVAL